MEDSPTPWSSWCRLCAKENSGNNVDIHFTDMLRAPKPEDGKMTLKEALEKYFWLQSSCEDLLPKQLCLDCYSLISSIMLFNEHVERVQQMYKFLAENALRDSCDLKSVRVKFNVSHSQKVLWYHPRRESKESVKFCEKDDSQAATHSILIKQENCIDETTNLSAYEETNKVADDCVETAEFPFDQVTLKTRREDGDPLDAMPEYADGESESESGKNAIDIEVKSSLKTKQYRTSKRKCKNARSRTSKQNGLRNKLKTIKCKKILNDDFSLEISCTECGKSFQMFSVYCKHVKETHADTFKEKRWICPICQRTFQTRHNFERHMQIHVPVESRNTVQCPECDNQFTSTSQLESHISNKHKNEKPFICEECGICVRTNSNLRQHMLIHTDNAPFECEICKKKFKNHSRLKIHMDIHSPNKHICAICGLQLNSKATLNRHFLVHSDEMQHKCDYCGRAFKRAKALKNHLILHTGLKPYSCDFCDRTFANGSNCRSHMKKMHPEELASLEASGNKTHAKNIPKLETLKAVTKAADNLTPVVTKFSGCFAFGKKPRDSADTSKTYKYLKAPKKLKSKEKSPLDGDVAKSIDKCLINASPPSPIPNFDNIYKHLMKHNPNDLLHIKRPPSSQSSVEDQNTSNITHHNPCYSQMLQANSSNTMGVSQSRELMLDSSDSQISTKTPITTIDDHSNPSPQATYYVALKQSPALPRENFIL